MHLQHWRSHKNTCHSSYPQRRQRRERARGIQARADANICWRVPPNRIPLKEYAAARHLVFSGLTPRQPKQPEQMENNHKAPTKLICEIKQWTSWVITLELALLHRQHPGQRCCSARSAESVASLHSCTFNSPQEGRLFVFAFIINRRMQGFSKVRGSLEVVLLLGEANLCLVQAGHLLGDLILNRLWI